MSRANPNFNPQDFGLPEDFLDQPTQQTSRPAAPRRPMPARGAQPQQVVEAVPPQQTKMLRIQARLGLARYYQDAIDAPFFDETDDYAVQVNNEIREFIEGRIAALVGEGEQQPNSRVPSQFTEPEAKVLKVWAKALLQKQAQAAQPEEETEAEEDVEERPAAPSRPAPPAPPRRALPPRRPVVKADTAPEAPPAAAPVAPPRPRRTAAPPPAPRATAPVAPTRPQRAARAPRAATAATQPQHEDAADDSEPAAPPAEIKRLEMPTGMAMTMATAMKAGKEVEMMDRRTGNFITTGVDAGDSRMGARGYF